MYDNPAVPRPADAGWFSPAGRPEAHAMEPQDRIAAWKRWEMRSFTDTAPPAPRSQPKPAAVPAPAPPAPPPVSEAELASLRLEAQMAGEKAGYEEGFVRGQAEGQAAAMATVHEQARQLGALALSLPAALRMAESSVADDLLALALDLARQVVGQALAIDPQAVLAVVHELLQTEPALTGSPQLLLHPDDARLVDAHLADELQSAGWRLRADAGILRGGCRVIAASGEHDATLQTRWERVTASLARQLPTSCDAPHG